MFIGSVELPTPVMNASGPLCTTRSQLQQLATSHSGAIVTKSMTLAPRSGNEPPKLCWPLPNTATSSINSNGLENLGVDVYVDILSELKETTTKPIIASVAAVPDVTSSVDQYRELVRKLENVVDIIELNLSCPNLVGKPIMLYQPEIIHEVLSALKPKSAWTIKLPPYNFNLPLFEECAEAILKYDPDGLVTMNSNPNCLDIDLSTRKKVIRPKRGQGGLGGSPILQQALGEVNRWYEKVNAKQHRVPIIGAGGVTDLSSALKHFMAGASAIQIGTWYLETGVSVFERLQSSLNDWLDRNGYSSVEEIVGIVEEL